MQGYELSPSGSNQNSSVLASKQVTGQKNKRQSSPYCNCTSLIPTSQQRTEARQILMQNQRRITNEELFDLVMENSLVMPLHEAFEPQIRKMFRAEKCVLWVDIPEKQSLYSPSFDLYAGYSTSIPGFIFKTKNVIQVRDPNQAPGGFLSDPRIASPNAPQLFFPLVALGTVRGAVQIVRRTGAGGFNEEDMQIVSLIMKKFSIYGDSFFTSKSLSIIAMNLYSGENNSINPLELLEQHFRCKTAELWHFDIVRMSGQKYDPSLNEMVTMTLDDAGIVGFAIKSQTSVNTAKVSTHPNFSEEVDAQIDGPALVVSLRLGKRDAWAVALRGRNKSFNTSDESQLNALLPFVVRSVSGFSSSDEQSIFNTQLSELLDVAALLTSSLNPNELTKIIQDQTKNLLQSEHCFIFIVDPLKKQLVSHFTSNDTRHQRFSIDRGIAGHVAVSKETMNLVNPTNHQLFCGDIDSEPGYEPRSLLSAPIFNSENEVSAVILLLSKIGSEAFDESDEKVLKALNVFSGIALENAKLYQTSVKLTQKLREFVEMTLHTNQEDSLKPLLEHILENAKKVMQSIRVSFFVVNDAASNLNLFVNVGKKLQYGTVFALESIKNRQMMIFNSEDIKARAPVFESVSSEELIPLNSKSCDDFRFSRISGIFTNDALHGSGASIIKHEKICCVPLFNSESSILGVLETQFYGEMNKDDMHLLNSFASIASLSLERIQLKELAVLGYGEVELRDWIDDNERNTYATPEKLKIDQEGNNVFKLEFDAPKWDGIGLFKVIFHIFDYYGLKEAFDIKNEQLFKFLLEIRATYNKVPYHNWRHAVDVTQFLSYEIITGKLEKIFTKLELLALFVAAVCHDANHDGFSNSYMLKAETPLGILFQNQSVMETHHCAVAISIIAKDELNLFHKLDDEDYAHVWDMIVQIILSTDMAKHFVHLNQMNQLVDSQEFDPAVIAEHRLLLLKNLLKCADISNVARPFELADRWCSILCEEFFMQGDLEKAAGMEYSSPMNDREHLDKAKSQIGFYSNVCLPLYLALAKAVPALKVNVQSVQSNLDKWKKAAAAEAKKKEEEKK